MVSLLRTAIVGVVVSVVTAGAADKTMGLAGETVSDAETLRATAQAQATQTWAWTETLARNNCGLLIKLFPDGPLKVKSF